MQDECSRCGKELGMPFYEIKFWKIEPSAAVADLSMTVCVACQREMITKRVA